MQLYLKKRLLHGCFPVNFVKFLRTSFLQNPSGRLLKYKQKAMSLVLYLFNYGSSKSTFFMLNMAFDVILSTIFVKIVGILRFLPYKEYKKIPLLALCILICTFFDKNLTVLHPGVILLYSILTSVSNSLF